MRNATAAVDSHFNLAIHENYGPEEARGAVANSGAMTWSSRAIVYNNHRFRGCIRCPNPCHRCATSSRRWPRSRPPTGPRCPSRPRPSPRQGCERRAAASGCGLALDDRYSHSNTHHPVCFTDDSLQKQIYRVASARLSCPCLSPAAGSSSLLAFSAAAGPTGRWSGQAGRAVCARRRALTLELVLHSINLNISLLV